MRYFFSAASHFKFVMCCLLIIIVTSIVACSKQQTSSSPETTQSSTGHSASEERLPDRNPMPEISIALGLKSMVFAPLLIADVMNFFADEGVNAKIIIVEGGGGAAQALAGGTVQFAATDSGGVTQANDRGVDFIAVEAIVNKLTMDMILSQEALSKIGLDRSAPIDDRLEALKGLTIGVTSSGSAPDRFTRYYMQRAGLTEDDVNIVAIGGGNAQTIALQQGVIDGFMSSAPTPQIIESEGIGKIFIAASLGDVPELANFPYEIIETRRSYAEENPDIVRAVAVAVARANNLMLDYPDEAMMALHKHFDTVDLEIFKPAFESFNQAVPRDGLMNEQGWQTAVKIHKSTGMIENDLPTEEGILWTNKYLSGVNGKSK